MSTAKDVLNFQTKGITREVQKKLSRETLISGARSADWWAAQSQTLQNKFMRTVRQGIENGEAVTLTAARITGGRVKGELVKGFMDTSRREAHTLVRQSVAEVANEARLESFKANADVLRGYQQLSTFDQRTTEICMAYSGATWDFEGNPIDGTSLPFENGPPRHWNCRSVLIPIVRSWEDMGLHGPKLSPGTRASLNGQVASDMSFDKWLKKQPRSVQQKLLGKAKAELFRAGQLNLKDLIDVSSRPLGVAELSAVEAKTGILGTTPGSKKEALFKFLDSHEGDATWTRARLKAEAVNNMGMKPNSFDSWYAEFRRLKKAAPPKPPVAPPVPPPKPPAAPKPQPVDFDAFKFPEGPYGGHRAGTKASVAHKFFDDFPSASTQQFVDWAKFNLGVTEGTARSWHSNWTVAARTSATPKAPITPIPVPGPSGSIPRGTLVVPSFGADIPAETIRGVQNAFHGVMQGLPVTDSLRKLSAVNTMLRNNGRAVTTIFANPQTMIRGSFKAKQEAAKWSTWVESHNGNAKIAQLLYSDHMFTRARGKWNSVNGFTYQEAEHLVIRFVSGTKGQKIDFNKFNSEDWKNIAQAYRKTIGNVVKSQLAAQQSNTALLKRWSFSSITKDFQGDIVTAVRATGKSQGQLGYVAQDLLSMLTTMLHEYGHQLHFKAMRLRPPFQSVTPKGMPGLTTYGSIGTRSMSKASVGMEWHAEHFVAYTLARDELMSTADGQKIVKYFDTLLDRLTAEGP